MRARIAVLVWVSILSPGGCRGEPADRVDGGPTADGGADAGDPAACLEPDRECPADRPLPGAPCEGELSCEYLDPNGADTWTYTCLGGGWDAQVECTLDGGCPTPPLAESCRPAFEGTLEGATVAIGPADSGAFRPFEAGEMVDLVWGPQGAPMFTFRVQVGGADAPACVRVESTLASEGMTSPMARSDVVLHCGQSLGIFLIVPFAGIDCEERVFEMDVAVSVQGVGTASARVRFMGGGGCFG